jgi:peptidoglycan/LPS O-acetylase OafA/YrhL
MVKGAATSLISTVVAIGGIAAAIAFVPMVYSFAGAALLFIPFVVFASGNTLFGALTCRPARLLGLVSYSVYVLHNWVLFVVSRLVDQFADVGSMPASEYWVLGAVMVLMTVVLSAITFRFVESPWLRSSRQVKPVLKAVDISDGLPPERG